MDKHLNLYYSYQKGDSNSAESIQRLEDNITRAFLITFKGLQHREQTKFINSLLGTNKAYSGFSVDIQNIDSQNEINKNATYKRLIMFGGQNINKYKFKNNLKKYNQVQDLNIYKDLLDDLFKKYKQEYDSEQPIEDIIENFESVGIFKYSDIPELYQITRGSRPDGWIYTDELCLLIESKISSASQCEYQIYRHLTNEKGLRFSLEEIQNNEFFLHFSWKDIGEKLLCAVDTETIESKSSFLVNEFKEYLTIGGEIMKLEYIIEDENNNDIKKKQLNLYLEKFDKLLSEKISKGNIIELYRKKRPKYGLWESFTTGDNAEKIAHYSTWFGSTEMVFSLTVTNAAKMKNLLSEEKERLTKIIELLMKMEDSYNFFISIASHKLIDCKRGQIRGDKYKAIDIFFCLDEIYSTDEDKAKANINNILHALLLFVKTTKIKELHLGFRIRYPKKINSNEEFNKDNIKYLENNLAYFSEPEILINKSIQFIETTQDLYTWLAGID